VFIVPSVLAADPLPQALKDTNFPEFSEEQVALGRLLFYDKILSGNKNISCGTCHHPKFGTSDGLPLGIGEGGVGLGTERVAQSGTTRIVKRIPRNAPALWNLGAREVEAVMHDGRISRDNIYGNGFNTPAEEWLPSGLNSLLAAQALFPLTSEAEMAGGSEENEVSGAVNDRIDKGWPIIAKRVRTIPEYGERFVAAFDHISSPEEVTIVDVANALAAFEAVEFKSNTSPFDLFLAGEAGTLSEVQKRGMALFFGEANCVSCHSGPLFTDQKFHAIGLPPFGPGRSRRFDLIARDVGRLGESDELQDAYHFRTPTLRNVAQSAPYGHNGVYATLEDMIRQHSVPIAMFEAFNAQEVALPPAPWLDATDFVIWQDSIEISRQKRAIAPVSPQLTQTQSAEIIAFLHALTDPSVVFPPFNIPETVPSGLSID
jgi:cytochrome c peroxidase